jgi:hypothetical protein
MRIQIRIQQLILMRIHADLDLKPCPRVSLYLAMDRVPQGVYLSVPGYGRSTPGYESLCTWLWTEYPRAYISLYLAMDGVPQDMYLSVPGYGRSTPGYVSLCTWLWTEYPRVCISLYLAMDGVPQGMYLSPPFSLARISSSCSSSLSSVSLPGVDTLLKGPFLKILCLLFISSLSLYVCLPSIISYKSLHGFLHM